MWRYVDDVNGLWDVVIGRASWGSFFAIFVPLAPDLPIRQGALRVSSERAAHDELDRLDAAGWTGLFERTEIKRD